MGFPALVAITFLTSAAGLIVEIVAGRMMAPFFGMSLQTWTVVISVVLLGFSLGHALGGRVADMETRRAWQVTGHALLAASVTTLIAGYVVTSVAASTADGIAILPMTLAATAAFFLPSFFVSFPTPFITKQAVESGQGVSGSALGIVYGASSLGAIAGSVSAGFLLVPVIGSHATMVSIAALYVLMALWAYAASGKGAYYILPISFTATAIFHAATNGEGALEGICEVESPYYCIRVDERKAGEAHERLLVLNQIVHAAIDPADPDLQPLKYASQIAISVKEFLARDPSATEIFFVGGGGYTIPAEIVKVRPGMNVTVSEIDEAVTEFVRARFPEVPLEGLDIVHEDGRMALARVTDGSLDVIVLDAFSDISVPEHLVTVEFMDLARRKLKSGGILVANVIDTASGPEFLASLLKTATVSLPHAALFTEKDNEDGNGFSNYVLVLSSEEPGLRDADPRMEPVPLHVVSGLEDAPLQTDDRSDANFLIRR